MNTAIIPTHLFEALVKLRTDLERAFSHETRHPRTPFTAGDPPSKGHCAAVALVVRATFGGWYVSSHVNGESHWFNRFEGYDVDLTGDQFGLGSIRVGPIGSLYLGTVQRSLSEVSYETWERALRLALRLKHE